MTPPPIGDDDLEAWIDARLTPERAELVDSYLTQHPAVRDAYVLRRRQSAALRAALAPVAEAPIPASMRIAAILQRHRPAWHDMAAAAVLLLAGLGGGWALRGLTMPPRGIEALAGEATDNFRIYASDRTMRSDVVAGGTFRVDWGRDGQGIASVPDLSGAGFRLADARTVATAHGPAALFLYRSADGAPLAVLVRPMEVDKDAAPIDHLDGTAAGVSWARAGIGYSLVGEQPVATVRSLATLVRTSTAGAQQ